MSLTNPIPRGIREAVLVTTPGQTVFGPFDFRLYDPLDVEVWATAPGGLTLQLAPNAFTVTPAAPAVAFPAFFTVTLGDALATGSEIVIRGARIPERSTDVTRAGVLQSQAIERELDKMTVVAQELRRDASRIPIDAKGFRLSNVGNPILPQDAATKSYVDGADAAEAIVRAAGDAALAAQISGLAISGPSSPVYASRTVAAAAVIAPLVSFVVTAGYAATGDGGGAQYYRKPAPEADRPGDFTSNAGTVRWGLSAQTLNIRMFGAKGDGVTVDNAARDAAIGLCVAIGNGTIVCPKGEYLFTTAAPAYSVPIMWRGEPGTKFKCVAAAGDVTFFSPTGSLGAAATIEFNSTAQQQFAFLTSAAGVSVGALLLFRFSNPAGFLNTVVLPVSAVTSSNNTALNVPNSLSVGAGQNYINIAFNNHGRSLNDPVIIQNAAAVGGQDVNGVYTVTSIPNANIFTVALVKGTFPSSASNGGGAGVVIVLPKCIVSGAIPFALNTTATTKSVQVMTPVKGGGFQDIDFEATGSTGNVTAIVATWTAFQTYRNLSFKGFKSVVFDSFPGCALMLNGGYANTIDNVYAEDCGCGGYNDISMYGQTRLVGRGIRSARAFGFGPGIYNSSYCHIEDITSDDANERGIKINATLDSHFNYLSMTNAGFTGIGFAGASARNVIDVVRATGANNYSLWFGDEGSTGNRIGFAMVDGTRNGADVGFFPSDVGNTIENLITPTQPYNAGNAAIYRLNGAAVGHFGSGLLTKTDFVATAQNSSGSALGVYCGFGGAAALTSRVDTVAAAQVRFYFGGGVVGSITTDTVNTAYNTTSDGRLKPVRKEFDAGPIIDAMKVVKHNWIHDQSMWSYGVIAQDEHANFPQAVRVGAGDPGDPDFQPWSVDYSKYVPLLIAEVQSLRRRLAEIS